jgi:hypothetical protein
MAALDIWFTNPGGSDYRAPGVTWDRNELERMHAALEAPTVDDALVTFGVDPGTWMTTPKQDADMRARMVELRHRLGSR